MIRCETVEWTYPHADSPSLHELDLSIADGEFVVLCGASGSGKSTALRLMNGLVPHFHDGGSLTGRVRVEGRDTATAELDELGRITGTVLQHPRRQFFTDTVPEELAFAMENLAVPPEIIRARVAADLAELSSSIPVRHRLQSLSGGQQQQVAIAAATAHRPRIVLLDEPSANLSADAVERLADTLARLHSAGVGIVVAEHRLRYLEHLADRIMVMHDGTIAQTWTGTDFRTLGDDDLAREGLRGHVRTARLPPLPAAGESVAEPAAATAVPHGALELEGVRCRLGGRRVLELDRVTFPAGAVTAIRGVNGAGKSTLARIIVGLRRAEGRIRLHGRAVSRRSRQRSSAIVMQDVQRQLFTDTVAAEIELASTRGRNAPTTAEVLAALDLDHLADRHPLSLSGGQQQRLVIAAVRVSERPVVIFDEPSSGVDRRHLDSISEQIRQIAATGAVVLLISHDEDLLTLAADHQLTLVPPGTRSRTILRAEEPLRKDRA